MKNKNLLTVITNIYKGIIVILTFLMFVIVGANVFMRYVLNNSLGWADELSRFIFIWVSFLGAVLAYHSNEHIGLDIVVKLIPSKKIQLIFRLIGDLGVLLVIIFLTYYGWVVASSATNLSPALYIPMKFVYMIIPVSAFLMGLINIKKIIHTLKLLKNYSFGQVQREV
ncbi:hypothetical protein BBF96_00215 [Anoxybacter fermentans]|uniref:Tripartite ATP-independent periplasmic transporters DctQ component domain-containing protein n=1 Tax=Anoxybacter fermentans TaxID=1323375 RepID=A0A3S9SUK0_9FIRM|nr:TRAP transporter small permease [Anoxybacter fermentans]AZR71964.1 hypothetical protein BBF96_00215 [Anoxybacter fermentans]